MSKQLLPEPIKGPYNNAIYTHIGSKEIYYGTMDYPGGHRGPCQITLTCLKRLLNR